MTKVLFKGLRISVANEILLDTPDRIKALNEADIHDDENHNMIDSLEQDEQDVDIFEGQEIGIDEVDDVFNRLSRTQDVELESEF